MDRIFSIIYSYWFILGQHLSFARSDAAWFVALAQEKHSQTNSFAYRDCTAWWVLPSKMSVQAAEGVRWRNVVLLSPGCTSSTFQWIPTESAPYTVKSTICWSIMRNIHSSWIHGMDLSDPWHMNAHDTFVSGVYRMYGLVNMANICPFAWSPSIHLAFSGSSFT